MLKHCVHTLLIGLLALALGACAPAETPPDVTMLLDATRSSARDAGFRREVTRVVETIMTDASTQAGVVRVYAVRSGADRPLELAPPPAEFALPDVDSTVAERLRPALVERSTQKVLAAFEDASSGTRKGSSFLRVLAALDTSGMTDLIIVGDGIDWADGEAVIDLDRPAADNVAAIAQRGLLPDLTGVTVTHVGAGEPSRGDPDTAAAIRRFWSAFYAATGAAQVRVTGVAGTVQLADQ